MRKIFLPLLILLGLFAPIPAATAQEENNQVLDFLQDILDKGEEMVGDVAPVITNCNYGNNHGQPTEQLCALLQGGGWVPGIGQPDTRIGLLIASLAELADFGRDPQVAQQADDLLNQWYDVLQIPLKRCTTSPTKVLTGQGRAGFCAGTEVSDVYKRHLRACSDGNADACKVTWEEWILIGSSLDLVETRYQDDQADWAELRSALDSYSQREQ